MNKGIKYVGLDVHKAFIQVAVLSPRSMEWLEWREDNTPKGTQRLVKKLLKQGDNLECCYEAGPTGFGLARKLNDVDGLHCRVIAPSLIPRKPGERIKTDRRDARKLAHLLLAGLLTEVTPPSEAEEARRELCRARSAAMKDLVRAKHRVSKFLLRHDRIYTLGRTLWTKMHLKWVEGQRFDSPLMQLTFDSLFRAVVQAQGRVAELDEAIERVAREPEVAAPVGVLMCFKGVATTTAMSLFSELYRIERFDSPRRLMSFIGLTPSEHSTGGRANRGGITKAGNGRVRKLLIEAAWNYSRTNRSGRLVRMRREGQPGWAVDLAEKAQDRLHRRYWKLVNGGKSPHKAVVAVARELAGFIWAALVHHKLEHVLPGAG